MAIGGVSGIGYTPQVYNNYGYQRAYQPTFQQALQTEDSQPEEKKNDNSMYWIGAGIVGLTILAILGHKGKLGEGIQKFLGGAEKSSSKSSSAAESTASKTSESAANGESAAGSVEKDGAGASGGPGSVEKPVASGAYDFEKAAHVSYEDLPKTASTLKLGETQAINVNVGGDVKIQYLMRRTSENSVEILSHNGSKKVFVYKYGEGKYKDCLTREIAFDKEGKYISWINVYNPNTYKPNASFLKLRVECEQGLMKRISDFSGRDEVRYLISDDEKIIYQIIGNKANAFTWGIMPEYIGTIEKIGPKNYSKEVLKQAPEFPKHISDIKRDLDIQEAFLELV